MKHCLLLFVFWFSMLGGSCFLIQHGGEECGDTWERVDLLTGNKPESLMAVVNANSVADVSLQQSASVCINSLFRRYPQFRVNIARLALVSGMATYRLTSCYQRACCNSRDCNALQKKSGYYLYRLCRLII